MSAELASTLNAAVANLSPEQIIRHVLEQVGGKAVVTTNFRPYEAVILHMATQVRPDIPVLWVDHGANFPETYRFAEATRKQLHLNLRPYLPKMTSAHWLALNGGNLPTPDEVERVEDFSRIMKLE